MVVPGHSRKCRDSVSIVQWPLPAKSFPVQHSDFNSNRNISIRTWPVSTPADTVQHLAHNSRSEHCVLWTHDSCHLHYWNYSGDRAPQILSSMVACWPALMWSISQPYKYRPKQFTPHVWAIVPRDWRQESMNINVIQFGVEPRTSRSIYQHTELRSQVMGTWWRSRYALHGSQPSCLLGWSTYRVRGSLHWFVTACTATGRFTSLETSDTSHSLDCRVILTSHKVLWLELVLSVRTNWKILYLTTSRYDTLSTLLQAFYATLGYPMILFTLLYATLRFFLRYYTFFYATLG